MEKEQAMRVLRRHRNKLLAQLSDVVSECAELSAAIAETTGDSEDIAMAFKLKELKDRHDEV